jgi:GDP-4-dehydro-6-deoxy-D-mannose reductase
MTAENTKALVTGADGFVGQYLIGHLLESGYTIAASTLELPPSRSVLGPAQMAAVDWKAADVRDHDALYRLIAAVRPDQVYHLAGFASGALARAQAARAMQINAGGTVNLCEAVLSVQGDFPAFDPDIFIMGSGDSYGDAALLGAPLTEEMALRPVSAYGLSKACQELAGHTYRRAHGLKTTIARTFNLIGPGQLSPFVVPNFCEQVAAIAAGDAEPVLHVGNLDVERDFTDVRDAVAAFRSIMETPDRETVYNVASGRPVAIRTIVDWIVSEAGIEVEIRVDQDRVRSEDLPRIAGDASRLRVQTGWEPSRSIEETVREVYRSVAE